MALNFEKLVVGLATRFLQGYFGILDGFHSSNHVDTSMNATIFEN
jgi:hypothetical protein